MRCTCYLKITYIYNKIILCDIIYFISVEMIYTGDKIMQRKSDIVIIRENVIEVEGYDEIDMLEVNGEKCKPEELIFFDLEHYVYKKPKCIGVFGACIYNNIDKKLYVTQYMIENKGEVVDILVTTYNTNEKYIETRA